VVRSQSTVQRLCEEFLSLKRPTIPMTTLTEQVKNIPLLCYIKSKDLIENTFPTSTLGRFCEDPFHYSKQRIMHLEQDLHLTNFQNM
jgi:hypothetical protein